MARNKVQFQRGLSDVEFERLYGTEEKCRAARVAAATAQNSPSVSTRMIGERESRARGGMTTHENLATAPSPRMSKPAQYPHGKCSACQSASRSGSILASIRNTPVAPSATQA